MLAAVASLALLPSGAVAAPTVSEYAAGLTKDAGPMGVTAGPDGAVWFTENSKSTIGRIAADGTITEFGGLTGSDPRGITTGPDGNVWFTEAAGGKGAIGRITPAGVLTEFKTGLLTGSPVDITAGPDGNLWFTENAVVGAIGRITPGGTIKEFTSGLMPNAGVDGITAGPDGNLWFAESNRDQIGRISPTGAITEFGVPPGSPREIVAGPDGNLWFTADASPGYIGRITPAGDVTAFSAGLTAGSSPQGIAAGADGALYFTEKSASALGRITTSGEISELPGLLSANSAPWGIAAGPDGNMWFAENANPGRLGRVTVTAAAANSVAPVAPASIAPAPVSSLPGADAPARGDAPPGTPIPILGRTVVLQASSGVIRVRQVGESAFRDVQGTLETPVGVEIAARKGTVVLTSALAPGQVQRARFRGARFKVRQGQTGGGLTDIVLTEPAAGGVAGAAAAARRRPPHSLWAHDSHGRYRTFGHNSVATVRGTTWRTTERADGTLTQVVSGAVSVRDLRRHRSILVRAGHRYLARAKLRG